MIELPDFAGHADALWNALLDLGAIVSSEWVLVGGQMVLLHAIEHGAAWPRVSMDLDVIVNARVKASVREFVTEIEAIGFVLDGMSPELLAHRYRRGAASIDVLAPKVWANGPTLRPHLRDAHSRSPGGLRRFNVPNELSAPTEDVSARSLVRPCLARSSARHARLTWTTSRRTRRLIWHCCCRLSTIRS